MDAHSAATSLAAIQRVERRGRIRVERRTWVAAIAGPGMGGEGFQDNATRFVGCNDVNRSLPSEIRISHVLYLWGRRWEEG